MKMRLCLSSAIVAIAFGLSAAASGQTLQQSLATAYTTNPSILAERAALRATDETVPQAMAGWRPTVSLTGQAGLSRSDTEQLGTNSGENRFLRTAGVTIRQPLYSGGGTIAGVAQAQSQVLAGRANLLTVEQGVLLDVATAYMDVVRDQAVVDLQISNEQVLKRQLDAARDRFRVGEITRTDVAQAESRLGGARADRIAAEGNLQASRASFLAVVGLVPGKLLAPQIDLPLPRSYEEAVAQAARQNPAVPAAEYAAQAALQAVEAQAAQLLPVVELRTDVQRQLEASTTIGAVTSTQAVLAVTVPLYESGLTYARVRAQKHTAGQRRIQIEETRRNIIESAARSWEALQTARAQEVALEAQIKANEIALEGVEREAQVGSRTVLDVLNAEQELFNARVGLVRAQREEMVAAFSLKAAIGELTAAALNLPVDVYDPAYHYEAVKDKWVGTDIGVEAAK